MHRSRSTTACSEPGNADAARAHVSRRYGVTKPFVLFVSTLWPYKNCDGLLRAWALAHAELGDRQLAIVGGSQGREVRRLASPPRDRTRDLGRCRLCREGSARRNRARFYQAADVFVYPSVNETFGLPILEAMACGCPVVTSDVSAMPETAGGAAILADAKDAGGLSARPSSRRLGQPGTGCGTSACAGPVSSRGERRRAATLDVYREAAEHRRYRRK